MGGILDTSFLDPQIIELQERSFDDPTTVVDAFAPPGGVLGVAEGGTGAANAATARGNLGAAASGVNTDITSLSALTSLTVGGGTAIKEIDSGTTSLDPASIAAQTRGSVTFTLTGAAVGDIVIMQPPSALNTGLAFAGAEVTGANTVTVYIVNVTGGAIDDGANTWRYLWFDLT